MKILLVGGTFDEWGGKASKIVKAMFKEFKTQSYFRWDVTLYNGGTILSLYDIIAYKVFKHDAVIWMPNISNEVEDKMINSIKENNPTIILVQSKRAVEKEYGDEDVIRRLLRSHSALGIKITKDNSLNKYYFSLLDPLGNIYYYGSEVIYLVTKLFYRLKELKSFTRYRSTYVGEYPNIIISQSFIDCVRETSEKFTPLVSGASTERFLGNASTRVEPTRCSYGFPAQRLTGETIAVSKRNINKSMLTKDHFVVVGSDTSNGVEYCGSNKPSVDAPIQIELFNYYRNVRYMIHGHVYIKDAPMTEHKVPCGALEEIAEIIKLYPSSSSCNFSVNLKGHGCIMLSDNVDYFRQQEFEARPFPEGE